MDDICGTKLMDSRKGSAAKGLPLYDHTNVAKQANLTKSKTPTVKSLSTHTSPKSALDPKKASVDGIKESHFKVSASNMFAPKLKAKSKTKSKSKVQGKKSSSSTRTIRDHRTYAFIDDPAGAKPVGDETSTEASVPPDTEWDQYGAARKAVAEWKEKIADIPGSSSWNETERRLHKLFHTVGTYPIFDGTWAIGFHGQGKTASVNIFPNMYAPHGTGKRVAIRALQNDFAAARAMERLFKIPSQTTIYLRETKEREKIVPFIVREIKRYIRWAMADAGLEKREYIPAVTVINVSLDTVMAPCGDESQAILSQVQPDMQNLAAKHRKHLARHDDPHAADDQTYEFRDKPPTVIAFVVIQHLVMIWTLDASQPEAQIQELHRVSMSEPFLWTSSTVPIALAVHEARDQLYRLRSQYPVRQVSPKPDPDL